MFAIHLRREYNSTWSFKARTQFYIMSVEKFQYLNEFWIIYWYCFGWCFRGLFVSVKIRYEIHLLNDCVKFIYNAAFIIRGPILLNHCHESLIFVHPFCKIRKQIIIWTFGLVICYVNIIHVGKFSVACSNILQLISHLFLRVNLSKK